MHNRWISVMQIIHPSSLTKMRASKYLQKLRRKKNDRPENSEYHIKSHPQTTSNVQRLVAPMQCFKKTPPNHIQRD